jgi:hypothetical protein
MQQSILGIEVQSTELSPTIDRPSSRPGVCAARRISITRVKNLAFEVDSQQATFNVSAADFDIVSQNGARGRQCSAAMEVRMLRVSVLAGASDRVSAPSYLDLVVTLAEASDDHELQHDNTYPPYNIERWHCSLDLTQW